jgi:hypothetical protein
VPFPFEAASGRANVEDWKNRPGSLWPDLAKGQSAGAYEAMGKLIASPGRTVPFLKKRLLVPAADGARLRRLIADLDSDEFATREAASLALAKLGRAAGPALRAALRGKPSLEMRRRLDALLRAIEREEDRLALAHVRAVQVLEAIGTKEAQLLLEKLAEGAGGEPAGREGREALQRARPRAGGDDHLRGTSAGPGARQARALAAIRRLGGKFQTEAGRRGPVVVAIDLSGTRATDDDLLLLSDLKSLRALNLFNTNITGPGLAHLKGLDALEEIDLSGPLPGYADAVGDSYRPRPLDDRALEHLRALPALRALNVQYTSVGERGLRHLGRIASLRELDLSYVQVSDQGLWQLRGLARLRCLHLRNAPVTDRGLEALARMEGLRELSLGGARVSDAGLWLIGRPRRLEDLRLWSTRVTDAGIAELRRALPQLNAYQNVSVASGR